FFLLLIPTQPISTLFTYTTLFRSIISIQQNLKKLKSLQDCSHILITLIAGGTGSVKIARGLSKTVDDLIVIPNIADNIWLHGLRSEEHTSELQSRFDLVCRLLLEK